MTVPVHCTLTSDSPPSAAQLAAFFKFTYCYIYFIYLITYILPLMYIFTN